ncbi:MAG TPA: prolyl oligopeptidase family serine peptidase [Pyrinomonadaceae bacterium]|nr:prolyl oligopeptidase family serine peptidase [Pyrinomonadaceae bacterium]
MQARRLRSSRLPLTFVTARSIFGEMDTNVDPSSTMQVVHQLIKHNKDFDLLVVHGANHGAARGDQYAPYGDRKRYDFFVRHLLGMRPPGWNAASTSTTN